MQDDIDISGEFRLITLLKEKGLYDTNVKYKVPL